MMEEKKYIKLNISILLLSIGNNKTEFKIVDRIYKLIRDNTYGEKLDLCKWQIS